jgi:hypothetical protein
MPIHNLADVSVTVMLALFTSMVVCPDILLVIGWHKVTKFLCV